MLDRETVERLLQNNLDAKLNSELSKYGYQLDAAHKLFRFITSIFERTPPELITWKFKVIMPVGDWDFSQKIILNFHRKLYPVGSGSVWRLAALSYGNPRSC